MIERKGKMHNKIPFKLNLARSLLKMYPFLRGRGLIERLLLPYENYWPSHATFRSRYGTFVNASLQPWPKGFRHLFLYGVMDESELWVWQSALKKGDVVIDGGANWGYWSLVASKLIGKEGRVFAFEPVPSTIRALQRNIRASGTQNVQILEYALGEEERTIKIHLADNDPILGHSSIERGRDLNWLRTIECRSQRLDFFLADKNIHPRLIKLDIEGGELFALKGASQTLQSYPQPVICFEWNRPAAEAVGYRPEDIESFLQKLGYELYLATNKEMKPFLERRDISEWSPMVWAITNRHLKELNIRIVA
jgi:FkbM family methyltransferase